MAWYHRSIIIQIAENINAGYHRKVPDKTVHHSLAADLSECPADPAYCKQAQWACEHLNSMMAQYKCIIYPGKELQQDALWEDCELAESVWCLGMTLTDISHSIYRLPLHGNNIPWSQCYFSESIAL